MKTYLADLWFERGEQYHFGKGVKTNFKASFQWYTKAVALDHIGAQFMVGEAYHCGHGAERNFNLAVEWYKKSMALGHAKGYHALGHLYSEEKQEGFVQDIEQAHELWRKAGEIGFPGLGLESHLENPHHFKC